MFFFKASHLLLCFIVSFLFIGTVRAQENIVSMSPSISIGRALVMEVRVADEVTLVTEKFRIKLWGVKRTDLGSPVFELRARTALENKIMGQPVTCFVKVVDESEYKGQCVNANEEDLSLYLLQSGYVSLNRSEIFSTIYEAPYVEAESLAQSGEKGIWATVGSIGGSDQAEVQGRDFMRGAFFLVCAFLLAIGLISFYIMRGFGHVVSIQNKSIDLATKERDLKDREKNVIASMIHAEIRENKPKIEAYLTVYEEMLAETMNSNEPVFMKTGEIVQKQPALARSIYDGNTGKMDVLGARMASEIIHYYARIKTTPNYIEIKPDMPVDKVREIIKISVDHAKKLDIISNDLLETFCNSSMIEDV